MIERHPIAFYAHGCYVTSMSKKDDRSKVENYRGITLLFALGKLFTSILKNRLYDYMVQKGILKAEQGGFRKMHSTVDSIFTLKMLIGKYVKSKAKKHRNLLFSCFVDLEKPSILYLDKKSSTS